MSVLAKVTGDIHPQVPGTADHLQDLIMQYVLCVKRGPGYCHPDDLTWRVWTFKNIFLEILSNLRCSFPSHGPNASEKRPSESYMAIW